MVDPVCRSYVSGGCASHHFITQGLDYGWLTAYFNAKARARADYGREVIGRFQLVGDLSADIERQTFDDFRHGDAVPRAHFDHAM